MRWKTQWVLAAFLGGSLVTHDDILRNNKENRVYCILNAPNKEAVSNYHKQAGAACEWIHEVESTK